MLVLPDAEVCLYGCCCLGIVLGLLWVLLVGFGFALMLCVSFVFILIFGVCVACAFICFCIIDCG